MGTHPSSIFAIPLETLTEARRDMWVWAEPVIADCAVAWYDRAVPSRLASNILAKKHCRLWQAVIYDQPAAVPQANGDLERTSEKFGLAPGLVGEVNDALLEELVDIVLSRYRGSRHASKVFSLILMSATSRLSAGRAAA